MTAKPKGRKAASPKPSTADSEPQELTRGEKNRQRFEKTARALTANLNRNALNDTLTS